MKKMYRSPIEVVLDNSGQLRNPRKLMNTSTYTKN